MKDLNKRLIARLTVVPMKKTGVKTRASMACERAQNANKQNGKVYLTEGEKDLTNVKTMATLRYAARFVNRNPRNLEMMGFQKPPTGYEFEKDRDRRSFIY
ncbi:hypothetical protein OSTOST_12110, partial [Ostertagia ostertagi]